MSNITVNGISKKYGDQAVLDNLTLTFEAGKRTALMGPSGCGKTTLLRIIAGLETADSGSVTGIASGDFGIVFQEPRLFSNMTAEQNVSCVRKNKNDGYAARILTELGFQSNDIKKRPFALSGGMQRRVAIARAIAYCQQLFDEGKHPILLLDEAIKELDNESKTRVINTLSKFWNSTSCTVIAITHDRAEADALYHTVISL